MLAYMAKAAARSRIDALLVERGLVESRQKARAVLLAGEIRVDGAPVTKPGVLVSTGAAIEVLQRPAYVSRGGDKLEHALRTFEYDPAGLVCADLGASTGGFTDCLLQHGASRVYAVDVGYGLIDYRLRQDGRVVVMERVNARNLAPLPEPCDLAVFDLSFIGVEKVIPAVCRSLKPDADLIVLLKPQFQARREEVGKKGVVNQEASPAWSVRITPKPGTDFQSALAAAAWNEASSGATVLPSLLTILAWVSLFCLA